MKLIVDLQVVGYAPQYESVKPVKIRLDSCPKNSPKVGVFFMYLKILVNACICVVNTKASILYCLHMDQIYF